MLDVVRADFAGDNVGCWMQIQVGKGPWASEVSGLVKIGQTMTMVLAIKDDEQKFDMLVRNCMAHDGKRAPIQLVDQKGCVTRPKLMSKFTKIKNFGASASVLSYAHFQAFKFPDSMEVHFQCTIQICRYQCPDQCVENTPTTPGYASPPATSESYGAPQAPPVKDTYGGPVAAPLGQYGGPSRTKRAAPAYGYVRRDTSEEEADDLGDIGVEKVIHVVSSGDLTFDIKEGGNDTVVDVYPAVQQSLHEEQVRQPTLPCSLLTLSLAGLHLHVDSRLRGDPHHPAGDPHHLLHPLRLPVPATPQLLRRDQSHCSIHKSRVCPQKRSFLGGEMVAPGTDCYVSRNCCRNMTLPEQGLFSLNQLTSPSPSNCHHTRERRRTMSKQ